MNKEKAVTMIALVVTMVVMLILAGVSLNLALSDNGTVDDVKGKLNLQKDMLQNHSEIMNSVISSQEEEWGISD
ncbi:unknown [Clostridium sp. CAG:793]|nr:unknown [Clostridium sp. CAG:793]